MEVRYLPDSESYRRMTTAELRKAFVAEDLFATGEIRAIYCDTDRVIVGGAVPSDRPLPLEATKKEMAASSFTERREIGIISVGGNGTVTVDGGRVALGRGDMLYVGRGVHTIAFNPGDEADPAAYYFASYPAHAAYPMKLIPYAEAEKAHLGSQDTANKRTINKYIHAGGARSAQLVMGMTELDPGNVWNTMPPHTHQRRMEVYLYYGLGPDDLAVHLMGPPTETRNLLVRNRQAVFSPSWSIHCASATRAYRFVWAMGGENQEFDDMDAVAMKDLR
jgi:4-deoxy-L-threo-5-hexosulose-uronate ketol-isomerase